MPLDIVSYRGSVWHRAGGTAGNVAAILGFLGWKASVVADLGDDYAGRQVRSDLQAANVSVRFLRLLKSRRSPRLVHHIDQGGHRYVFSCPVCTCRFPKSGPLPKHRAEQLIASKSHSRVYFFDRVNIGTVLLAEYYRSIGSFVVFEPSIRGRRELVERALDTAHLVKQADDCKPALDGAVPREGQLWIVTNGSQGARFRLGKSDWTKSPGYTYPIVDAGGAGDWMTAGLVHILRRQRELSRTVIRVSLRWAQALAAVSCGVPGARGLAYRRAPRDVIRAATRLEERGAAVKYIGEFDSARSCKIPQSVCYTCLERRT